jgi:hypothetical protein
MVKLVAVHQQEHAVEALVGMVFVLMALVAPSMDGVIALQPIV